jgi:hypothetical protein
MNKGKFYIIISLFLLAACTQNNAPIVLKGQDSFGKNATSASEKSGYTPPTGETSQDAFVQSVGVADLTPPPIVKKPTKAK